MKVIGGRQRRRSTVSTDEFRRRVEEARSRHNISDIVARHTKLKARGPREMVGLCPFHEERSPSFEVNDTKGTYHCWGCGAAGDALSFLVKKEGMRFGDALATLAGDAFPIIDDEQRTKRKQADERALAERIEYARSIWDAGESVSGTIAEFYLRNRGITMPLPPTVRFGRVPRWRNLETGEIGRAHPTLICSLQAPDASVVGVQCVFLRPDGTKLPDRAKLSFGAIIGSAFHLGPPASRDIMICEGPEDGLTLAQEFEEQSVWVTCGTEMMPRLSVPATVRTVILAGDNNNAGRAAVDSAKATFIAQGIEVRTIYPAAEFKDWNDMLRGIAA